MLVPTNRPLLQAADAAIERQDFPRAEALFLEHLSRSPADPVALIDYGNFCLLGGRHESACYLLHKASNLLPADTDVRSQLGYARLETLDVKGARDSFEAALELAPAHAQANYGLALCQLLSGETSAAVAALERSLAAMPDTLPILLSLADACHRAGDATAAGLHYERAWRLAPDDLGVLLERGKFLRDTGAAAQAIELFMRCLRARPDEPIFKLETARCLRSMGESEHAIQMLIELDKFSPGVAEVLEELGNCYADSSESASRDWRWQLAIEQWIRQEQFVLAKPLLEKLLGSNPTSATTRVLQGVFHGRQQQFDLAEAAYIKAIEIDPGCVEAHANLASLYEQTNQLEQAQLIAEAGLQLTAVSGKQLRARYFSLLLTSCRVARRQKKYLRGIEFLQRIDRLELLDADRQQAGFERAKLLDLLGNEAEAISAFNNANAIARVSWLNENPGKNTYLSDVEYMLELANNGWLKEWRAIEECASATTPVFLLGFPRSGTTLLNQILYCHSGIQTLEEKPMMQAVRDSANSMPAGYPNAIANLGSDDVAYLRDVYSRVARRHGASDPSKLLVDKLPLNATMAGLIHQVFPQARFVFAARHPCDVVLSCFMQDFRINEAMANFCTLADSVALYTRVMDLWQAYRDQLALTVHTVRYEDIVDDFDGQILGLCRFLQVPWEDSLQQFAIKALDRGKINTPSYEQVSQPLYRDSRYRWERYRAQLSPYLSTLRPYAIALGYPDPLSWDESPSLRPAAH